MVLLKKVIGVPRRNCQIVRLDTKKDVVDRIPWIVFDEAPGKGPVAASHRATPEEVD